MFSIFDRVSETYSPPFVAPNAAVALRFFEDQCDDETSIYNRHRTDFKLYEVGTWEAATAATTTMPPVYIGGTTDAYLALAKAN